MKGNFNEMSRIWEFLIKQTKIDKLSAKSNVDKIFDSNSQIEEFFKKTNKIEQTFAKST